MSEKRQYYEVQLIGFKLKNSKKVYTPQDKLTYLFECSEERDVTSYLEGNAPNGYEVKSIKSLSYGLNNKGMCKHRANLYPNITFVEL